MDEKFITELKQQIKEELKAEQDLERSKLGFMERNPMFTTYVLTLVSSFFLFGLK